MSMSTVACFRCHSQVPVAGTTFTETGDYLCRRCTDVVDQANTIERSRQATLAEASRLRGHGLGGLLWSLLTRGSRIRKAESEHAAFVATLPNVERAPKGCSRCGAALVVWNDMCERCAANPQ